MTENALQSQQNLIKSLENEVLNHRELALKDRQEEVCKSRCPGNSSLSNPRLLMSVRALLCTGQDLIIQSNLGHFWSCTKFLTVQSLDQLGY